jgi:nitrile hydratase
MNGMHDVGGMDGFGPVVVEKNEPVFHYPWEGKAFAMNIAMGGWRKWNLDQTRSSAEKFTPRQYLAMSYYERWVTALADRGIQAGLFSAEEVKAGHAAAGGPKLTPPIRREMVPALVKAPWNYVRPLDTKPMHKVGDMIRTVTDSPESHTRLPRYARGARWRDRPLSRPGCLRRLQREWQREPAASLRRALRWARIVGRAGRPARFGHARPVRALFSTCLNTRFPQSPNAYSASHGTRTSLRLP